MKALLACALLFAGAARAQDTDAPLALTQGTPAPTNGVFLTTARASQLFSSCDTAQKNAAAFQAQLEAQPPPTPGAALLVVGGVGLVLGAIAGALVVAFTKK